MDYFIYGTPLELNNQYSNDFTKISAVRTDIYAFIKSLVNENQVPTTLDITDSLKAITLPVMLISLLAFFATLIALKSKAAINSSKLAFFLFGAVLNHLSLSFKLPFKRIVLYSFLMLSFMIIIYYEAIMSTDLVAFKSPKLIETLEDLAESGRCPTFLNGSHVINYYKESKDPLWQGIWKSTCKSSYIKNDPVIMIEAISKNGALVMKNVVQDMMTRFYCQNSVNGKNFLHSGKQEFARSLCANVIRKAASNELYERLYFASLSEIEFGLFLYWKVEMPRLTFGSDLKTERCVNSRDYLPNESAYYPIKIRNVRRFFLVYSLLSIVAFACLIAELIFKAKSRCLFNCLPFGFCKQAFSKCKRRKIVRSKVNYARAILIWSNKR